MSAPRLKQRSDRRESFHWWLDRGSLYLGALVVGSIALNCAYGAGWL